MPLRNLSTIPCSDDSSLCLHYRKSNMNVFRLNTALFSVSRVTVIRLNAKNVKREFKAAVTDLRFKIYNRNVI
jgi:hypothetical protein